MMKVIAKSYNASSGQDLLCPTGAYWINSTLGIAPKTRLQAQEPMDIIMLFLLFDYTKMKIGEKQLESFTVIDDHWLSFFILIFTLELLVLQLSNVVYARFVCSFSKQFATCRGQG